MSLQKARSELYRLWIDMGADSLLCFKPRKAMTPSERLENTVEGSILDFTSRVPKSVLSHHVLGCYPITR
jgi:hypothetical protein